LIGAGKQFIFIEIKQFSQTEAETMTRPVRAGITPDSAL